MDSLSTHRWKLLMWIEAESLVKNKLVGFDGFSHTKPNTEIHTLNPLKCKTISVLYMKRLIVALWFISSLTIFKYVQIISDKNNEGPFSSNSND